MDTYSYTTDSFTEEQAFLKADIVLTGLITQLGMREPEGPGQMYFQGTKVEVIKVEKGLFTDPQALINYQVWSMKNREMARTPEEGKQYKFYITVLQGGKALKAFKIHDL